MIYFTSDFHFFHKNILKFEKNTRPFKHYEEMTFSLIQKYNSMVNKNDTVFILGDVCFGIKEEGLRKTVPFLNGRKYLILGNHDLGFNTPVVSNKYKLYMNLYKELGIIDVFRSGVILENIHPKLPERIRANHFPYMDSLNLDFDNKFQKIAPRNDGLLLFHGHTHQTNKITGPNQIHVGLDSWNCAPVSIDILADLYQDCLKEHSS